MTFKEWLSRWFHHRSTGRTAVGTGIKFLTELTFWSCLMAVLLTVATFIPIPSIPEYKLFNTRFWLVHGSLTMAITISEFCIFTLPRAAVESGQQD